MAGCQDGFLVEGTDGAQVDDFHAHSLAVEYLRGLDAVVEHQTVGDNGQFVAAELYICDADRDRVFLLRYVATNETVGTLVFQKYCGIVVADGALEQALGIIRRRGRDDFEAGRMAEEGLGALGVVEPTADPSTLRGPQHERYVQLSCGAVSHTGRLANDLVYRGPNEVGELDLGNGPHPVHCSAEGNSGY